VCALSKKLSGVLVVHACFTLSRSAFEERLHAAGIRVESWQSDGQFSSTSIELSLEYFEVSELIESMTKVAKLRFEIVLWPTVDFTGERWVFSPVLGRACVQIDAAGNQLLGQGQLMQMLRESGDNALKRERLVRKAMLVEWDDEFEELREMNIAQRKRLPRVG
jgi:hypothetical protein